MKVFSASAKLCTEVNPLAGALVQLSNVHRRNNSSSTAKIGELCDAINQGRQMMSSRLFNRVQNVLHG